MKFLAATFPGNERAKICKIFRQIFAAFFARMGKTFRLNFALRKFLHNKLPKQPASQYTCRKHKSIHQYGAKRSPANTWKAIWCIFSFALERSFCMRQTSFLPAEALGFS